MISFKSLVAAMLLVFATAGLAAVEVIEINTATVADLDGLKGIGPALSGRILEARQHGEFKDWADLRRRVKGIGDKMARRLSLEGLIVNGDKNPQALLKP